MSRVCECTGFNQWKVFRMTLLRFLVCSLFFVATLGIGNNGASHADDAMPEKSVPKAPNIIVIFVDDLGFGDVGFNGATVPKTPYLDHMAAEGMKFTDFYVGCAVCSGSRTSLLTGCHYQRLSMAPVLFPSSTEALNPNETTLANMLKAAGYQTACVGKWHLGHLPPCLPTYQGFDSYCGVPYSNDMWIDPANKLAEDIVLRDGVSLKDLKAGQKIRNAVPLMSNEEVVEYPANQSTLTKRYTEESIRFIKQNKDQPFFLYLPHSMVHLPLAVSEAFNDPTKDLITNAIEEVDWSVGQILQTLKDTGISEKTLVVFTSDNGAAVGSSLPLRAKKGSVYDGGIREPTVMWWPGQIPAGSVCQEVAASIDLMPTFAALCNGQLSDQRIDGKNIWPLMKAEANAVSPHENYVLMHGLGTVRSGKWKFYPWPEGNGTPRRDKASTDPAAFPVQLYDTVADIGETQNVAELNPLVSDRLLTAYNKHLAEIKANRRPTATMVRPDNALSPERPEGPRSNRQKKPKAKRDKSK